MSLFNTLRKSVSDASSAFSKEVKKFRSKDLMRAIVAGATLVAYADGEISGPEKTKLIGFFRNSDALSVFETDEVIAAFNSFAGKLEFDPTIGTAEVFQKIALFKDRPEAQIIAGVCKAIAMSDGSFDQTEKKAMASICNVLGLAPENFV